MKWRISLAATVVAIAIVSYLWLRPFDSDNDLDSATYRRACQLEEAEDWRSALEAWKLWNPRNHHCGTCEAGFRVDRQHRIFHCMVRLGNHASVACNVFQFVQAACRSNDVELGLGWEHYERNYIAHAFVPMLVDLYDRADQVADLRRLVKQIEVKARVDCRECKDAIYAEWPTRAILVRLQGQKRHDEIAELPPAKGSLPRVLPE